MCNWEKSVREDRSRKNPNNPSFSSMLLDEIYRSIDGGAEKIGEFKARRERTTKKQSNNCSSRGKTNSSEDEEMANLRRVYMIEKWMEKKDMSGHNNFLFFSSSSSSSDSSFGGFSSSETESIGAAKSLIPSFAAPQPKHVRTSFSTDSRRSGNSVIGNQQQSKFYLFDEKCHQANKTHPSMIKSKTRAMKIYDNLKKMKQPISPGGRISNFLTSIFTNGNGKKTKNSDKGSHKGSIERKEGKSTCSSASSLTRSCLNKNPPKSREKLENGNKRMVRFYPVSSRPCDPKSLYERSSRQGNDDELNSHSLRKNYKATSDSKSHITLKKNDYVVESIRYHEDDHDDDDDDDDAASESSSDLFELDHLSFFKNDRFSEELPVYETTYVHTNRAIASGLIL